MKSVIVHFVGKGPYSQSRNIDKAEVPMLDKESHDAYEQRTWRHRMHVTPDGFVEIPGACFVNSVRESAKRCSIKVPNKRGAMFGKFFDAGVQALDNIKLPIKAEDVKGEKLFVPSDGKPGGGSRVYKWFPRIDAWEGTLTFLILDDTITEDVFRQALANAGLVVGVGRFRPEKRGYYGRFVFDKFEWRGDDETRAALGMG